MFCCAAFVLGSVGQEFFRGTRARRAMAGEAPPVALLALVRRNRRRYGGYVVHLGIAVLFVGVAASSSFQHAVEQRLSPGSSTHVGAYTRALRAPDGDDHAEERRSPHRLDAQPRRRARRQQGRAPRRDAAPERGLLRLRRTGAGHRRAPDRRSGRQPHQHERRRSRATCGRRSRRTSRRPTLQRIVTVGNRTLPADEGVVALGVLARAYLKHPPAGAVPLHRLAAGDVDLDRRPDRASAAA